MASWKLTPHSQSERFCDVAITFHGSVFDAGERPIGCRRRIREAGEDSEYPGIPRVDGSRFDSAIDATDCDREK